MEQEMKTATFIKKLDDFRGDARLYKLSDPMVYESYYDDEKNKSYDYVVVSSANVPFSGPETYIFGADKKGEVVDWMDLPGSRRGSYSHEDVLEAAGYKVE
jgi:hypothetical protein